jgi:purine-nucleoside phosphorylase
MSAGCNTPNSSPTSAPAPTDEPVAAVTEAPPAETPAPAQSEVVDPNILYQDDFTNPSTGWAAETFDNYFIGYHEPEYYHIAITSPNYKTNVFIPGRPQFTDTTIEVNAFTFASKTAEAGDFRYGIAFRRSGDQFYAFTVSQRSKSWAVIKSTGSGIVVLQEGTEDSINDFDVVDILRVDASGSTFFFHINDKLIAKVEDPDYASGEVGFYVQTLDAPTLHIHYDSIVVKNYQAPDGLQISQSTSEVLYTDDFTKKTTGWPEKTFDNYFIGYHEPEYYHVAISSTNYKTTVFIPGKPEFSDSTIEVSAFTFAGKTAEAGDFRYGIAFRRTGDDFYAFTVSQRTKRWAILKSTPNELLVIREGTSDRINDFDVADALRVDAKGSTYFFHINDEFIAQLDDPDYEKGETGFFVQTLDAPTLHIHYDSILVRDFEPRLVCTITALQMNLRTGPGKSYTSIKTLTSGDNVQPVGISSDAEWISVKIAGTDEQGWIANVKSYVSCNSTLSVLPTLNP